MAVGLPIIAPSYAVEIAKIIEAEGCGLLADFEDPASVAEAILKLHRNPNLCRQMGQRAREAFEGRYNWEVELRPLLDRIISWFPDKR
jgi:glycosyltransferase involved in cell wall biosynthesis